MSTGETWTLGHRPALDGLRGIAVLLVMAHHALGMWTRALGTTGVTAFFTLSGFLITVLLLEELERSGGVNLPAFYARRARRLLPALVAFLAVVVPLGLLLSAPLVDVRTLPAIGVYVGNWLPASGTHLGGLEHMWSLAVEEQFYLVWPVVLIVAATRFGDRGVAAVAALGIAASVVARFAMWDSGAGVDRVYFGTDTRLDGLLVGCLAAVLVRGGLRVRGVGVTLIALGALAAIAVSTGRDLLAPTLVPWLAAVVVVAVASGCRVGFLEASWLTYVGRRSYALYLWHFPLMWLTYPLPTVERVPALLLALLGSWLLAELSWRLVESRWLNSGRRAARSYASAKKLTPEMLGAVGEPTTWATRPSG